MRDMPRVEWLRHVSCTVRRTRWSSIFSSIYVVFPKVSLLLNVIFFKYRSKLLLRYIELNSLCSSILVVVHFMIYYRMR